MIVGHLIKAYRQVNKLSIRDLAQVIGIDHNALWRLERGEELKDRQWVKVMTWMIRPIEQAPVTTEKTA